MPLEYFFSLVKPDSIARGLIGHVISRFEAKGLKLVDIKWKMPDEALIRATYADKETEDFFPELLAFMLSGPSIAMVWQGEDANERGRQIIGVKDPLASEAGSLRGLYASDKIHSVVHGSRSPEEAWNEMLLWFGDRWEGEPIPAAERPEGDAPYDDARPLVGRSALGLDQEDEEWRFPLALVAKGGEWEEE